MVVAGVLRPQRRGGRAGRKGHVRGHLLLRGVGVLLVSWGQVQGRGFESLHVALRHSTNRAVTGVLRPQQRVG